MKNIPKERSLATRFPELLDQWDYSKNEINPEEVAGMSSKKVWWICPKGHSYQMAISNKTSQGQGCPICAGKVVLPGFNDLASQYPDVAKEWDSDLNGKTAEEATAHSSSRAYWICPKGHSYITSINDRTREDGKSTGCPYCAGKKAWKGENDLATLRPDLASQWDYEKNYPLTPEEVTEFSMKKVWWRCEKGHSWHVPVSYRTTGNNCPYCSNQCLLTGYNDLATTHPDIAKEWDFKKNQKNPKDYIAGTHTKVWWICPDCGNSYLAVVKERAYGGTGCPRCAHYFKTSFPEQAVFYYARKYFPDAVNSYKPVFLGGAEIDIYIPSLKTGIEYDGFHWHYSTERDAKKTELLAMRGISLIRLREEGLPELDDGSICISVDQRSHERISLNIAIQKAFTTLESRTDTKKYDIDVNRDNTYILELSEGNKKEKSLIASGSEILEEWNYEKNGILTPDKVTAHSMKKVWWKCSECGKEWQQFVKTKYKGGLLCESCSKTNENRRRAEKNISEGKSHPLTDYPELVEEWYDEDDITKYSYGSDKKARWKCSKCGNIFYQPIKQRTINGYNCPVCHGKGLVYKGQLELQLFEEE